MPQPPPSPDKPGEGSKTRPSSASLGSRGTFSALRHRNFRLLIGGQFSTSSAMWMEMLSRGWLIYDMTGSAFLLGAVQAVRAAPLLFLGPIGGVMADRLPRKRQLIVSQLLNMALNILLATLIVTGLVEVWHVFVTSFLTGCVMAFQQPARHSLIPNTVPRSDLVNAIGLNSVVLNSTHSIGPAMAGVMVSMAGTGGSYYAQAALYLIASLWTYQLRVDDSHVPEKGHRRSMSGSLVEGFRYIRGNQAVFVLLALSLLPIVLAQPYSSLLPVFAKDIFDVGPGGLGVLLVATGVGSVIGAFLIAAMGDFRRKGWYMLITIMAYGLSLVAFAATPWMWAAALLLGLAGFAQTTYRVVNQTLLLTLTEDEFRGRVMSVYLLDRGLAPLGALLAGTLAALLGAPWAVAIMGAITFLAAAAVALKVPRLHRM